MELEQSKYFSAKFEPISFKCATPSLIIYDNIGGCTGAGTSDVGVPKELNFP